MPQAIVIHEHGGSELLRLEERDPGEPGPGSVRIRVSASGANFIAVYMRTGLYPRPTPFVVGLEGAGVVETTGAAAEGFAEGDRVAWAIPSGSRRSATDLAAPDTDAVGPVRVLAVLAFPGALRSGGPSATAPYPGVLEPAIATDGPSTPSRRGPACAELVERILDVLAARRLHALSLSV